MNAFFTELDTERRNALLAAQQQHPQNIPGYIIEKDLYVTCILEILYTKIAPSLPQKVATPFIFKGGTSLSKCHSIINRMSEDIDLSFSMGLFDKQEVVRTEGRSRGDMHDEAKGIESSARQFATEYIIDHLEAELSKLDSRITVEIENDEPLHLGIHYPSVVEEGDAVQRRVLLETGSLSQNTPVQSIQITHMLGDTLQQFQEPTFDVIALAPERTLVEKMFGVHCNLLKGACRPKYARHLYDILQLHERNSSWCDNKQLLLDHVEFSYIHYRTNVEQCEQAKSGPLVLCPNTTEMLDHYRLDWEKMEDMFPFSNLPYTFDELVEKIAAFETHINKLFYKPMDSSLS